MGLLDLGFGSSSQNQKSSTTQKQTQNQTQTGTGSTTATTLDPKTVATLQGIIQQIAPQVGQSADADIVRQLSGKLAGNLDPALVTANIQAAQTAATRNFNVNQGAQIANLQQQIGSKGNTFSTLVAGQGQADLAGILQQIATQGQLSASAQQSSNLAGAISGFGSAGQVQAEPLKQLLAVVSSLTGAETKQNSTSTSISDLISNLVSNTTGKTSSQGFNVGLSLPSPSQ